MAPKNNLGFFLVEGVTVHRWIKMTHWQPGFAKAVGVPSTYVTVSARFYSVYGCLRHQLCERLHTVGD